MIDRNEIGRKIINVSQGCADGYRRNISQFNTAHENETAERCACAASNTGYFLLEAFGFSKDERQALMETYHSAPK